MKVYAVSRSGNIPSGCIDIRADLVCWSTLESLLQMVRAEKRLDILVHAAGMFYTGQDKDFLEMQECVNTNAPTYLSYALLPELEKAHGQVIFLNSQAGLRIKNPKLAAYGASKAALKTFVDAFRMEVNSKGIRVSSLFLGKVATPMQETNCRELETAYLPSILLQPEDVASTVVYCLNLPRSAEVTDLTLRSMHV